MSLSSQDHNLGIKPKAKQKNEDKANSVKGRLVERNYNPYKARLTTRMKHAHKQKQILKTQTTKFKSL